MFLKQLSLINFKNYRESALVFSPGINCFTGANGAGKTNLLDALHYLSFCKSFFNPVDSQNIFFEQDFFVVEGNYVLNGEETKIYCGQKRNQKKQFRKNKKEYERLADHIGLIPLVMISPADSEMLNGGSEERRKFLDSVIAQYDRSYLEDLLQYNRALAQRNSLLKQMNASRSRDISLLEPWDLQMAEPGERIHAKRKDFLEAFIPVFKWFYAFLSEEKEDAGLDYSSKLGVAPFEKILKEHVDRDLSLSYTGAGIHKDDLDLTLDGHSAKKFGSQGQQKSLLIALRLAQYRFIRDKKSMNPILLLDDIAAKLDEARLKKLVALMSGKEFGQVFITDTSNERMKQLFGGTQLEPVLFEIKNGKAEVQEHVGA